MINPQVFVTPGMGFQRGVKKKSVPTTDEVYDSLLKEAGLADPNLPDESSDDVDKLLIPSLYQKEIYICS